MPLGALDSGQQSRCGTGLFRVTPPKVETRSPSDWPVIVAWPFRISRERLVASAEKSRMVGRRLQAVGGGEFPHAIYRPLPPIYPFCLSPCPRPPLTMPTGIDYFGCSRAASTVRTSSDIPESPWPIPATWRRRRIRSPDPERRIPTRRTQKAGKLSLN